MIKHGLFAMVLSAAVCVSSSCKTPDVSADSSARDTERATLEMVAPDRVERSVQTDEPDPVPPKQAVVEASQPAPDELEGYGLTVTVVEDPNPLRDGFRAVRDGVESLRKRVEDMRLANLPLDVQNDLLHARVRAEMRAVDQLVFELVILHEPLVDRPQLLKKAWVLVGFKNGKPRPNSLLIGECGVALDAVLQGWGAIVSANVETDARRQLDAMQSKIVVARAAVNGDRTKDVRTHEQITQENTVLRVLVDDLERAQDVNNWDYLGFKRLPGNELLVGGYANALSDLFDAIMRVEYALTQAEAHEVFDEMSRAIIEARRVLWGREQAKKKDGKHELEPSDV